MSESEKEIENVENTNKFRLKNKEAKIMNAALKKNIVNSKINEVSVLNNAIKEKLNQFNTGIDNLNLNPLLDNIQYILGSDNLQGLANNVGNALQKISGMILALKGLFILFKDVLELKEKFDLNAREIKVGSLRAVERFMRLEILMQKNVNVEMNIDSLLIV